MAKRKTHFFIIFSAVTMICLFSTVALSKSNAFIVITNASTPVETISISELRDIYNGDRVFWKSGKRIRAARLRDDYDTSIDFLTDVLGKSPSQYVQHWRHKLFSGKGLPPKVIEDAEKMVSYVEENDTAIGFIPATSRVTSSKIKTLEVTE